MASSAESRNADWLGDCCSLWQEPDLYRRLFMMELNLYIS